MCQLKDVNQVIYLQKYMIYQICNCKEAPDANQVPLADVNQATDIYNIPDINQETNTRCETILTIKCKSGKRCI